MYKCISVVFHLKRPLLRVRGAFTPYISSPVVLVAPALRHSGVHRSRPRYACWLRGQAPLDSPVRVQRDRVQSAKSWGTRQHHAKANEVVDVARDVLFAIGAAHVLRIDPEDAAPQDAELLYRGLQSFPFDSGYPL
jgi:hypothetical protein